MFNCIRKAGAASLILGMLATAPAHAADIEIKTPRGPANLPASPVKIAVMDITALDTIDLLGVKPVGVPERLYVDYLKDLGDDAQRIGSLFQPDFEAIHALQPDLVVVGGRSSKQYDAMTKIAPTIDMTVWGEDIVGQAKARLAAYGALFGKEQDAKTHLAAFEAKIAEAKNTVKDKGNALIILTNGPKISAYGASGRFSWLHEAIELPEAIKNVEEATHGEAVSFEFIREANPDWLIVIDRSAAVGNKGVTAKETLNNALIHDTKAWKSNQIVYLDAANIYIASGGIQSMTNTLDEIITAFGKAQ